MSKSNFIFPSSDLIVTVVLLLDADGDKLEDEDLTVKLGLTPYDASILALLGGYFTINHLGRERRVVSLKTLFKTKDGFTILDTLTRSA